MTKANEGSLFSDSRTRCRAHRPKMRNSTHSRGLASNENDFMSRDPFVSARSLAFLRAWLLLRTGPPARKNDFLHMASEESEGGTLEQDSKHKINGGDMAAHVVCSTSKLPLHQQWFQQRASI